MNAKIQKILSLAASEIGYIEGANKDNKYGQWFGLNHVSECGIFVSWAYFFGGAPLGVIDFTKGFASVPFALAHFTKTGEITKTPSPGDIVFMSWYGKTAEHVGIVEKIIDANNIQTIEANTSDAGSQKNGGCTQRKIRQAKFIMAYAHPKVLDI